MTLLLSLLLLFVGGGWWRLLPPAGAARILLTNLSYPHLTTETGALLRWGEAARLQSVHRARWIEVAPRGIRLVADDGAAGGGRRWSDPTPCAPVADALCATPHALLFPSPSPSSAAPSSAYAYYVVDGASPLIRNDSVAVAYAREDACALHGAGRVFVPGGTQVLWGYTVTACDVMEGHLVALYDTVEGTVRLAPQTLGPMAYCILLLQAAGCLYCATSAPSRFATYAAASLAVSNALVAAIHGVPFLLQQDAAFFWVQDAFALASAFTHGRDACIHALSATACAVYRSTENAYAGIVCTILLVRAWAGLLRLSPHRAVQCAATWGIVLWQARIGVAPQLGGPRERWPFLAGLALYISLAFAVRRHHHHHPSSSADKKR